MRARGSRGAAANQDTGPRGERVTPVVLDANGESLAGNVGAQSGERVCVRAWWCAGALSAGVRGSGSAACVSALFPCVMLHC
ncbi:hypothetical protein E2C01_076297 [Portunus trituberculatus]|uniref:Uncharacterized protein n=1 Tax=Portunus trituberculatus TaxID=210409 RepID=A0A5B7ILN5_PORTR|nr:hypothetical protein [Portunus trituberculatus]